MSPPLFPTPRSLRLPRTLDECDAGLAYARLRVTSIQDSITSDAEHGVTRSSVRTRLRDETLSRWEARIQEYALRREQLLADAYVAQRLAQAEGEIKRLRARVAKLEERVQAYAVPDVSA